MLSRFNLLIPNGKLARYALYNSATGNYLVMNEEQWCIYDRIEAGHTTNIEAGLLFEAGFAVEKDVDEVEAVREVFETFRSARNRPHLTIAPTMDCNFGCEYCFETHRPGAMSEAIQDRLLEFLRSLVGSRSSAEPLSVTWFGGEPLLAMPVIRRLTRAFLSLCREGVLATYKANIITNGSGLTETVGRELEPLSIERVQVTLDGPAHVHDRRRNFKSSKGPTFDRILANLGNLPDSVSLVVRMNVDRQNMAHAVELLEELDRRKVLSRAMVDLARVENFGPLRSVNGLLSSHEFATFKSQVIELCKLRGWPLMNHPPSPSLSGVCQVDSVSSFVVDTGGELYKCWAELGNGGIPVARLDAPETWDGHMQTALTARDPFDDEECVACELLPTCLGGCPQTRELNRRFRRKECPPHKYHFRQLVLAKHGDITSIKQLVRPSVSGGLP